MAGASQTNHLPNLNFEKHVVRTLVTPSEALPLPRSFDSREVDIVPVLFSQVRAVGTIFLVVPRMIVVAVPSFMMIVGPDCHGGSLGRRRQKMRSESKGDARGSSLAFDKGT